MINKQHLLGALYFLLCLLIFGMVAGCKENRGSGIEYRIVPVIDANGVVVNFNCPVFNETPMGAHGRECFILRGDK